LPPCEARNASRTVQASSCCLLALAFTVIRKIYLFRFIPNISHFFFPSLIHVLSWKESILTEDKHQCLIQILIIKKTHFILQAQIESTTNFVILLSNRSACFTFVAKKTFDQSNLFT
jgi:hypothetical protein